MRQNSFINKFLSAYYTYENYEHLAMPNFTDFHLDLSEFSAKIPNLVPNITLPKLNLTLPDISNNMPRVTYTYKVYKEVIENRVAEASDYVSVVAESCLEEMRRFWRGIIG